MAPDLGNVSQALFASVDQQGCFGLVDITWGLVGSDSAGAVLDWLFCGGRTKPVSEV